MAESSQQVQQNPQNQQISPEEHQRRREEARDNHKPHVSPLGTHSFEVAVNGLPAPGLHCRMNLHNYLYYCESRASRDAMDNAIKENYNTSGECQSSKPKFCFIEHEHRDRWFILNRHPTNRQPGDDVNFNATVLWIAQSKEKFDEHDYADILDVKL